jgi:hypothetical protein
VRATCLALSAVATEPLDVVVLARNATAAADVCHVARLRAALLGREARFTAVQLELPAFTTALAAARPDGVFVAASTQSPWERLDRPSAWTALLQRAGFGLTLPFQAEFALAAGRAVGGRAFLVNACYPDAVNPLLAALGVPVVAGVGNVGSIAAALQCALDLPDQRRLQVLAHHLHLTASETEPSAWLDGAPVTDVGARLAAHRARDRRGLNDVTGLLAAQLLTDLLSGATRDTHVPGVGGLPGGYPVRVSAGSVSLRLPAGVDQHQAVRANQGWAEREGVVVDDARVRFSGSLTEALMLVLPAYADGFAVAELAEATAALRALRARLRQRGDSGGG